MFIKTHDVVLSFLNGVYFAEIDIVKLDHLLPFYGPSGVVNEEKKTVGTL